MNTVEILKGAKALLETKGWTQGTYGRDGDGNACGLWGLKGASCFCGAGAVIRAAHDLGVGPAFGPAISAIHRASGGHFPDFNDAEGRTKEEVLAVFDKAIAAEEGRADA